MGKTKILIRAFTCRRDVPSALVLKKCLEFFGYEVIVSSIRDFERNLKLWKPSIAISNILNTGYSVKKINPKIKTVFFDGEGFQTEESAHYLIFKKHPELLKNIDMIFLWGDKVANELKEAFPKYKNIYVVGWPNLDLIRYNCYSSPKKTIGFVMRSPAINDHQGVPTIRTISNKGNLERIIHQCEAFVSSFDCIKEVLEKTNYNVSIRPHPLEQIESYIKYKKFWFKQYASRVFIDDTLCFSEWLRSQRLIISPTSTSLLEAYLLKVPVINIDYLAGNAKYNKDYAVTTAEWQSSAYLPKTMKEFIQLIKIKNVK